MTQGGLQTRRLVKGDAGAVAVARAAGAHGIYVQNALAAGLYDGYALVVDGRDEGVCWFGPRGNLVVAASDACAPFADRVAQLVQQARWPWRIAMGPAGTIGALRDAVGRAPLVDREQVYYVGVAADAPASAVRDDVRRPGRDDRERLARATLALNASDLNIAPGRVDRRWLYDTIDDRIADGTTRVLGPVGGLWCKLDFGSDGPGGRVIEGVFTFPERRGRGLGRDLVASVLREAPGLVSLHVGEHNRPARAAYEKAGMREAGRCRLLLLG